MRLFFGWDCKNRGPISQHVWHDKDPSLLKCHKCRREPHIWFWIFWRKNGLVDIVWCFLVNFIVYDGWDLRINKMCMINYFAAKSQPSYRNKLSKRVSYCKNYNKCMLCEVLGDSSYQNDPLPRKEGVCWYIWTLLCFVMFFRWRNTVLQSWSMPYLLEDWIASTPCLPRKEGVCWYIWTLLCFVMFFRWRNTVLQSWSILCLLEDWINPPKWNIRFLIFASTSLYMKWKLISLHSMGCKLSLPGGGGGEKFFLVIGV